MISFLKIILLNKRLILLSSPLQALNYNELINSDKKLSLNLKRIPILICADNADDNRYFKINFLLKKLNYYNRIIFINSKIGYKFLFFLTLIRKFLMSCIFKPSNIPSREISVKMYPLISLLS